MVGSPSSLTRLSPYADSSFAIVFANDQTALAVGASIASIAVVPEPGTAVLLIALCLALLGSNARLTGSAVHARQGNRARA